jgi:uncharacterized protein YbaA (DUF1428 family)
MARYVDGYVLPVPKKNVAAYRRMAQKAGKVWKDHGALEYRECVGDDLQTVVTEKGMKKARGVPPFAQSVRAKSGETVVFSWIVFRSRADRDRVNAKVMKDPRIAAMMEDEKMPFDVKRMLYGGFRVIVEA